MTIKKTIIVESYNDTKIIMIELCRECNASLKEYNPYVDIYGNTIPLDHIRVKEVSRVQCANAVPNLGREDKKPIVL